MKVSSKSGMEATIEPPVKAAYLGWRDMKSLETAKSHG
jgi:hypothetical protein